MHFCETAVSKSSSSNWPLRAGSRGQAGSTIHFVSFDNRLDARKYLVTTEGEAFLIDVVNKNAHKWRRS